MGNNIAKHIFNLAFGQKQHVTLMVASRYLHSKAPLLSGKRMVSLLLVFLLSLLDYFTQKGRSRCARWEPSVSTVETGRFHGGNRSFPWWEQTRNNISYLTRGLSPCEVKRLVVSLLLMLVVGVNNAWGQTDYSGTYYIASNGNAAKIDGSNVAYTYDVLTPESNYYIVPASNPQRTDKKDAYFDGPDETKPFLTTYQTDRPFNDAVWELTKVTDNEGTFYYVKHAQTGKYVIYDPIFSGSDSRRKCMHLEKRSTLNDSCKFVIEEQDANIAFVPKIMRDYDGSSEHKYWNIADKNRPCTYGLGGNNYYGGLIGLYKLDSGNKLNINSKFKLEDIILPVIEQQDNNKITITCSGCAIYYTIDNTTPNPSDYGEGKSTQLYDGPFDITEPVTTIKAVAVKPMSGEENFDTYSRCVTFTTLFLLGNNHKYLLQSVENTNFYMIQGDYADPEIRINTSSLARPSMLWYFLNAGIIDGVRYYYMVNNKDGQYACFYKNASNNDIVCLKDASDFDSSDQFKFSIQQHASGGYFIKPLNSSNGLNKGNGNNEANSFWLAGASNATARWNILAQSTVTLPLEDTSFDVSTENNCYYYKIGNAGTTDPVYYIIPPTGTTGNAQYASTSSTEDDNMVWFFKQAGSDDWLNYYYIVNAQTGKYLYYNGQIPTDEGFSTSNNPEKAFTTEYISESGKVEDRYQFVIAKTTTEGQYYIVPKFLKYCSNTYYYMLWRDGTKPLRVNLNRKDANRKWTFTSTTYHCTAPEVTYDNTIDKVVISSPQGVDIYYTTNGANNVVIPSSSTHYTLPLEIGSTTQIIRAVCARSADGADNSNVVKIIFNPTITLSDASVTYDGSGHQPTISRVEYNSTDITSECTFAKYLDANGNVVSECVNAGEYKVVITDADGGDYFVYGSTTFTIDPITGLIVTPNANQSKEYGDPDPELTYTCSGTALLTGDELTGALSRAEGETVGGTYAINQGTLGNTNYDITFTSGITFTITPKSLGSGSTPAPNITCDVTETGGTHSIVVKQCGNDLTLGTDYTKDNEDDGAKYYDVTVAGTGNYTGGFNVKLAKIQLSKLSGSSAPGGAALFVSDSGDGNFVVPDNMTAYIVTGINGNTLVTEQLDNIPDHVPVLLVSTIDANGFLVNTTTGTTPSGTNLLEVKANDWENIPAATIYLLYNGEFVLNAAGTLPAGKIYLPRTSGAPSRLFINWDEVTGIEDDSPSIMDHSPFNEVWYTLDGRRLNGQPKKKGLYLNNGKKVVIR